VTKSRTSGDSSSANGAGSTREVGLTFGSWLRWRRRSLDLTQEDLAQQLGYSVASLRKIEGGERRASRQVAERLAAYLEIPPAEQAAFIVAARGDPDAPLAQGGHALSIALPAAPIAGLGSGADGLSAPRIALPLPPTPFVGRAKELAQLAEQLAEEHCRLLTITGPGGCGKTRLALQATTGQIGRFADGICFVDMAPLASAELLAPAILAALDLPVYGGEPERQLMNHLCGRQMLLVLDNFEHLLAAAGLLPHLLRVAPRLKLLVTSRERLNLQEEYLAPLAGLELPPAIGEQVALADGRADAAARDGSLVLEDYDATLLFLHSVRRLRPDYRPGPQDVLPIVAVCRLVGGWPLGIELAAAWARLMPIEEIAEQLARCLDLLSTTLRDLPERHRSMRAALDQSWRLLASRRQSILGQLAVFCGGFTQEAAEAVAQASLADLSALVDASWLQVETPGRYALHELVRQYCGEKADQEVPGDHRVRDRHAAFYAGLPQRLGAASYPRLDLLNQIAPEMGNLLAACQWAIDQGDVETARPLLQSLYTLAGRLGWYQAAAPIFETALQKLKEEAAGADLDASRRGALAGQVARLFFYQANCLAQVGHTAQAQAVAEQCLALLRELVADDPPEEVYAWTQLALWRARQSQGDYALAAQACRELLDSWRVTGAGPPQVEPQILRLYWQASALYGLGSSVMWLGNYPEGLRLVEQSLGGFERIGAQADQALALLKLGLGLHWSGHYEQAENRLKDSLRISRAFGDRIGIGSALGALAHPEIHNKNYVQARDHLRESLAIGQETGNQAILVQSLVGLGFIALDLGRPAEAQRLFEESLSSFDRFGTPRPLEYARTLLGLARVALARSDTVGAQDYLRQMLSTAGCPGFGVAAAIAGMAEVYRRAGQRDDAAELATFVVQLPATMQEDRERAAQMLRTLAAELSPAAFARAQARGRQRSLEEVVACLLATAGNPEGT
jgi:predicted ATPase/transcriptional regulator with XRE-family HTH domain